ncbi:hypothetical protein [Roseiconus lacunae]|uniref:hypothetical protein n=1 Tax=Roseiconus lacunae TaxID=2605694 RepID=UPI001E523E38|nr:hypothetical protein [Roseiconus lacunae]MCD0462964.1 hypothetical protein [Roseiconus lacunae]
MKYTEAKLEEAIISLLGEQGYPHTLGTEIDREPSDVLIRNVSVRRGHTFRDV